MIDLKRTLFIWCRNLTNFIINELVANLIESNKIEIIKLSNVRDLVIAMTWCAIAMFKMCDQIDLHYV